MVLVTVMTTILVVWNIVISRVRSIRLKNLMALGYAKPEAKIIASRESTYRLVLGARPKPEVFMQVANEPNWDADVLAIAIEMGYDSVAASRLICLLPNDIKARICAGNKRKFVEAWAKWRMALESQGNAEVNGWSDGRVLYQQDISVQE